MDWRHLCCAGDPVPTTGLPPRVMRTPRDGQAQQHPGLLDAARVQLLRTPCPCPVACFASPNAFTSGRWTVCGKTLWVVVELSASRNPAGFFCSSPVRRVRHLRLWALRTRTNTVSPTVRNHMVVRVPRQGCLGVQSAVVSFGYDHSSECGCPRRPHPRRNSAGVRHHRRAAAGRPHRTPVARPQDRVARHQQGEYGGTTTTLGLGETKPNRTRVYVCVCNRLSKTVDGSWCVVEGARAGRLPLSWRT